MDFFARQDKSRANTRRLVVYFSAGVVALICAVYLAFLLIMGVTGAGERNRYIRQHSLWQPKILLGTAAGTLAVIAAGALFRNMELSRGGSAVATMLGGRLLNPNTAGPDERKLLNVVEEMALASGTPVPQVYLLDQEEGINAFAAGHSPSDAVIGVTRGAVRALNRDELQGVIGHEFSHILNGDMRLNLRLMSAIFGIMCLAIIGRILLRTRGRKNPLPIFGLALVIIGWIGVFFGHLIQAAVSRQREFLADASAVQFTRNPQGLAGALKKIGGAVYGSHLDAPRADEASHLFFGSNGSTSFLNLLATHPPLEERIRLLDPTFDGKYPLVDIGRPEREEQPEPPRRRARPMIFPFPGQPPVANLAGAAQPPVIRAADAVESVGTPTPALLRYADELRTAIPDRLREASRDPMGACSIVYGLLLSGNPQYRDTQLQALATLVSSGAVQETQRLLPELEAVATRARLPLVDIALPALRELSPAQFQQFREAVRKLTELDGEIDLFEYVLQKIVLRHLSPNFLPAARQVIQYYTLKPLVSDCTVLLSALAYVGNNTPDQVEAAFGLGAARLERIVQQELPLLTAEQCGLGQVDVALSRLAQSVPQIRKNVLSACVDVVAADGVVQETEAELLRAIADALDCPLPPMVS